MLEGLLYEWLHRTASIQLRWGRSHTLLLFRRTKTYLSFKGGYSRQILPYAHPVLLQCIPNLFSFFHFSRQNNSINQLLSHICPYSSRCQKQPFLVEAELNPILPYKTMFCNKFQAFAMHSSSPSTYFMHHHHLCPFKTKRLDQLVICCVHSKSVPNMLALVSVSVGASNVFVCKFSCVSMMRQCVPWRKSGYISAASHRTKAATACLLTVSITPNAHLRLNLAQAVLCCPSLSLMKADNSGRVTAACSVARALHALTNTLADSRPHAEKVGNE